LQEAVRPGQLRPALLSHRFSAAIGIILIVGAALRVVGAQGTLWLDEIWSLKLIYKVQTEYDVFWGLTIDNNHYLNTLYLYLVGPEAPVLLQRGLSILLGGLSIAAAGWVMRGSGRAAMLAAMLLFALSYPMVNYGSEARGYSGLTLMTVLAIGLVELSLNDTRRALPVWLGIAVAAGVLFQPVMGLGLAILGLWATWIAWRATRSLRLTETVLFRIFTPTAILMLAIVAVLVVAIVKTGGYQFGSTKPFTVANFVQGYGGMIRFLLGLPDGVPTGLALLIPLAALGLAFLWRAQLAANRLSLAVIALVIAPAAVFCLRPPNVEFPRYYLASGIVLLLLLADLFAIAQRSGGWRRIAAAIAALLFVLGSGLLLQKFYLFGRGDPVAVLRIIAADPDPRVTSNAESRDQPVIGYLAHQQNLLVRFVPMDALCRERPTWLVTSQVEVGPDIADVAQPGCSLQFRRTADYPAWGLSGIRYALYRLQ